MKNVIRGIIAKIPKNKIFDAHTIFFKLRQDFSDDYLNNYNGKDTTEVVYHMRLSKIIVEFENDPTNKILRMGESWSKNVRDKYSPCMSWKKL